MSSTSSRLRLPLPPHLTLPFHSPFASLQVREALEELLVLIFAHPAISVVGFAFKRCAHVSARMCS